MHIVTYPCIFTVRKNVTLATSLSPLPADCHWSLLPSCCDHHRGPGSCPSLLVSIRCFYQLNSSGQGPRTPCPPFLRSCYLSGYFLSPTVPPNSSWILPFPLFPSEQQPPTRGSISPAGKSSSLEPEGDPEIVISLWHTYLWISILLRSKS